MNKDKLNVLHLMTGFGGGISSFILNKAEEFIDDSQISFSVLTFDNVDSRFEKAIKSTGGKIYKVTSPKKNLFLFIKEVNRVFNIIPENTTIHAHFGMNLIILFWLLSKKSHIKKLIIHAHTSAPLKNKIFMKNQINRFFNRNIATQMVSCGSKATENIFGKNVLNKNKVMHIPNSINPIDFINAKKISLEMGKEKQHFFIGHIGRFHPVKNHYFMIDIIEKLSKTDLKFKWVFVGTGSLENEIKKVVEEKKLSDYTLFLGRRNDIPEILKTIDLFVLPSQYEGLPTVAIEAQSSGTKCLLGDNITVETDLGMDLVTFLPISDSEIWVKNILDESNTPSYEKKIDVEKIEKKKFTNEASAALYKKFLLEEIEYYDI